MLSCIGATGVVFGTYFMVVFAKAVSKGCDSPFDVIVMTFKAISMTWFIVMAAIAFSHP